MRVLQRTSSTAKCVLRWLSSAAASDALAAAENSIYKSGAAPGVVNNLVVAMLEGKGRALIARHSLASGDIVMAGVRPLVLSQGAADAQPAPEHLVPAVLQASNDPQIAAALRCLFDGTDISRQLLPDLMQMMPGTSKAAAAAAGSHGSHSSCCDDPNHNHNHNHSHGDHVDVHPHQAAAAATASADLTAEQAALIVKYNAFGDDWEDLAAAAVRGAAQPHSHVGIWPQFSLANHSCLPNTVHYVVGHGMVVRAVEDVPAGHEVTVSYLGREDFSPAGARQAVLQERYGFTCSCQRCNLEQAAPQQLQRLVQQVYMTVMQDLKPHFLEAVEQQNAADLSSVHASLLHQEQLLGQHLQQHSAVLSHNTTLILQAAVYDLYELLLFCEQLLGARSGNASEVAHAMLARLGHCLSIMSCVSRGAELHVYVASRLLQHAVDLRGSDSAQAEAAAALFQQAHMARYGHQLEEELLLQLMEANKQAAEEFLM